jgi:hypothetical protein
MAVFIIGLKSSGKINHYLPQALHLSCPVKNLVVFDYQPGGGGGKTKTNDFDWANS